MIFIASGNNGQFRKLCELVGRPDLADDPRFANNGERNVNRVALTDLLRAAFAEQDGNELALRLIRNGVPAGPVLPVDQATAAPHTAHREMVTELDWYKGIGTPIKFSRTPRRDTPATAEIRPEWRRNPGAAWLLPRKPEIEELRRTSAWCTTPVAFSHPDGGMRAEGETPRNLDGALAELVLI